MKKMKDILLPNEHDKVYIPNEIFKDFKENDQITAKNTAFIYTYYCLITYLYRYCKYGQGKFINNGIVKQIMGYSNDYDKCDYLIKKGGVLDQIGYTQTIRDFPINYNYEDGCIEFEMYGDLDQDTKKILNMPKNFIIKVPEKAFYRTDESRQEQVCDGTYYEISNTHLFDVNLLIDMMDSEIGVTGFYIYQYFKHKNDLFKNGYNIGRHQLEKEILIPWRTSFDYICKLEEKGYLSVYRDDPKGRDTLPNTYNVRK